jgi:hypothetical protein
MKNLGKLIIATFVALASISCGAFAPKPTRTATQMPTATLNDEATIVIDQSSLAETNMGAEINSGFLFVAQTFTAQVDGVLAGVSLDIIASSIGNYPLHVSIRTVETDGTPGSTILGETTLDSRSAPLARIISFPQTIAIRSGDHYAIVVNYEGGAELKGKPLGMWQGATGDPYPGGKCFSSESDGLTWVITVDGDYHFQTFVMPGPWPSGNAPIPADTLSPTGIPPSSEVHLSASIKGLTNEKDQIALWSGDNETHRYCFSDCRDTSDLVRVTANEITVREGYPITYDTWGLMLDLAPNSAYPRDTLEVSIQYKGEIWSCINDLGDIEMRPNYWMVYVADMNPQANGVNVLAMPPYFTCLKK